MSPDVTRTKPEQLLIGVTGNIACGKSTVTDMLARLGATVIDADQVYHDLIVPGASLWRRLVERYGQEITLSDGQIDRKALGRMVFNDPPALTELEVLTHPAIRTEVLQRVQDAETPVVAVSAVKLIEGGWKDLCDTIWLVTCSEENQRQRLLERRNLTPQEVDARISAQPPVAPKIGLANVIIDNNGPIEDTHAQLQFAWNALAGNSVARSNPNR